MAFMGVRSSWLMLARNHPLARLASSAESLAWWNLASACLCRVKSVKIPRKLTSRPFSSWIGLTVIKISSSVPSLRRQRESNSCACPNRKSGKSLLRLRPVLGKDEVEHGSPQQLFPAETEQPGRLGIDVLNHALGIGHENALVGISISRR